MLRRLKWWPLAVAAAGALLAAEGAPAATQIGQTFTATYPGGGTTVLQAGSPGGQYTVPAAGVITSWSFQAGAMPPAQMRLKVGRPAGLNDVSIIGQSGFQAPAANVLNSYPVQLPVQAGDVIGFYFTPSSYVYSTQPAGSGYFTSGDDGGADVPPGQSVSSSVADLKLDISAVEALKPSNTFSFGNVKKNRDKGTATLPVRAPGPGTLTLTGNGVVTQRPGGATASKTVTAAGTVKLLVRAKGGKRRRLNKTGRVKVRVNVTYTPVADLPGDPNTQSKRVKLIKKH